MEATVDTSSRNVNLFKIASSGLDSLNSRRGFGKFEVVVYDHRNVKELSRYRNNSPALASDVLKTALERAGVVLQAHYNIEPRSVGPIYWRVAPDTRQPTVFEVEIIRRESLDVLDREEWR